MRSVTVLSEGTRVHHCNQLWTYGWTEQERQENPQWGWGTVVSAVPQHDGSVEYEVRPDGQMFEDWPPDRTTWWPSYYIDEAHTDASTSTYREAR